MNPRTFAALGVLAFFFVSLLAPRASAALYSVTDVNPDPNIFECYLNANDKDVTIAGSNVHATVYRDISVPAPSGSDGIPIPVIKVKVGDLIICHFVNELPAESASIHWHGIELDNDSDGTAVTQDAVLPGQTYTYQFLTFRPGLFWFHSHMMPGNTAFAGMYGAMIIENDIESSPDRPAILPAEADTHTLALSDIEFDAMGKVGKSFMGGTKTINELVELCHLSTEGEPGGEMGACSISTLPGSTVLVNGQSPDAGAQTPRFVVPSGKKIRLRLLSEGLSRHFRLKLIGSGDNKLYRIGGQGGLLDHVVLNGGTKGTWDTKYDLGEIALGSGDRADVIIYPTGNPGEIIRLVGNPLPGPFSVSSGLPADYPVAYFEISGTASDTPPAAGDPVLAGTAEDVENLKTLMGVTPLEDAPPFPGSSDETIRLTTTRPMKANSPSVDGFSAALESNTGNGDFLLLPRPPTSRYAHVGDLLELSVRNETSAAHPYHLHGFSMQPVRMTDNDGNTLYEFDYDEFLDTIDVYGGQTYVFRVRIDDRPKICDVSPDSPPNPGPVLAPCANTDCGGVVGRWLYHCHIFSHAGLGMMGEITILPDDDLPPEITCPADIILDATSAAGAVVNFAATATDDCDPAPAIAYSQDPGTTFAIGTTIVTAMATDSSNNMDSCQFTVTVRGPRAMEMDVLVQLGILRGTLTIEDQIRRLDHAIDKLNEANNPESLD